MLFSLIIPAYKVEAFIKKCLDSVKNQQEISQDDYEIIVVDDGSPDRSGEIAENELAQFNNSTVIHQPNGGLSIARNNGLKQAQGKYVWFIDSDDWIAPNSLSILKKAIDEHSQPDVIMFKACRYYENGVVTPRHGKFPFIGKEAVKGTDVFITSTWQTCAQFYLMNRTFLNDNLLEFMPGVYHEDNEFTPRMLCQAASIAQIDDILYNTFTNSESITNTPNYKRATDMLKVCNSLDRYMGTVELCAATSMRMSEFIAMTLNTSLNLVTNYLPHKTLEFNDSLAKNRHLFRHLTRSGVKKYQVERIFFTLCKNYVKVYSLMSSIK